MPALLKQEKIWTPVEYLNFERQADVRHGFLDGYIFSMAGENLSHSRVCVNLTTEIGLKLRGKPCKALSANMKFARLRRVYFLIRIYQLSVVNRNFTIPKKMWSSIRV